MHSSELAAPTWRFGNWLFLASLNTLEDRQTGTQQIIEPHLGQLLLYFIQRPNQAISRDELIQYAWPGIVSDAAVNQAIANLRKALQDNASKPSYIQTISKQGYRFIAQVEHGNEQKPASVKVASPQPDKATGRELPPVWHSIGLTFQYMTRKSLSLSFAMTLLLLLTLSYYLFSSFYIFSEDIQFNGYGEPITTFPGLERFPAFHPSKPLMVFSHQNPDGTATDLMLSDNEGNIIKNITSETNDSAYRSAWSPDGNHLAYVSMGADHCEIRLIKEVLTDYLEHEKLANCDNFDVHIAWSANGNEVLFNRRAWENGPFRVCAVRLTDHRQRELTQANEGITGDIAFAINKSGDQLSVLRTHHRNQPSLWLYDLTDNTAKKVREFDYWVQSIHYDNSGEQLLFTAAPFYRDIMSYHLKRDQLKVLSRLPHRAEDPQTPPWGGLAYVQRRFNSDIVWQALNTETVDTNTGITKHALVQSTKQDWQPLLSPDGSKLAFMSDRSGHTEIWLKDLTTNQEVAVTQFQSQLRPQRMSWSPDTKTLAGQKRA